MAHHVLHISAADRLPVLIELTSGPGRKLVFTRTKHRARLLARQLSAAGVPAGEMHSNLTQARRVRNLTEFSSGRANVLVATDLAARGLHIDDVELVIHADPPLEHKAYLHRSGRTARAGAGGTVVTLATEGQRADVAKVGQRAGVNPVVTQHGPGRRGLSHIIPAAAMGRSGPPSPRRESSSQRHPPQQGRSSQMERSPTQLSDHPRDPRRTSRRSMTERSK